MFDVEKFSRAPLTWEKITVRCLVWQGRSGNAYEKSKNYLGVGGVDYSMLTDRVFVTDKCEGIARVQVADFT